MSNEEILREIGTKRIFIFTIRKIKLKFLECIMRKEDLENLALTGHIDGKRSMEKVISEKNLFKWMANNKESNAT